MSYLGEIVALGARGQDGTPGIPGTPGHNDGNRDGTNGSKGWFSCTCATDGLPGANAPLGGGRGGAAARGQAAPALAVTVQGGLVISALLFYLLPEPAKANSGGDWMKAAASGLAIVFRNPQSILCGVIAGLLFIPTTIFDMVWGVRYLQDARGFDYATAVLRSAAVPFGWIIGCPLLGWLSDRIGRRKPVIVGAALVLLGTLAFGLYGPHDVLPPYLLALVAGIASGAAMIPYTVIKEANRPEHSGTATSVINFINFSLTALFGPLFASRLTRVSGGLERELADYQATFQPMLYGVALAILLTLLLRETGPRARRTTEAPPMGTIPAE